MARPPWDAAQAWWAWQQTWAAGLDPQGIGRWWQQQRLQALLKNTLAGSPLYAQRAKHAHTLADFAPIGKTELMTGFDRWATDRRITLAGAKAWLARGADVGQAWLGRYLLWTSSGTTGEPGLFVQDAATLAAFDAIDAQRLRGPLALPLRGTTAYVGAISGAYAGHVYMRRLQQLLPAGLAPPCTLHSVLKPIHTLVQALQAQAPGLLITYPSCAQALAQQQQDGALRLRLQELWLGGEQLSPRQRRLLQSSFGCTLRNSYGASEFFSIAFECAKGQLHVNEDWVILEPVDSELRPVPAGELSHSVLLTNLANHTQPLIRYRLSDRVRFLPAPCACGNRFAAIEVQGRADDTLNLPAQRGAGKVCILPLALETAVEEGAGVSAFQCLQRSDGDLELRLQTPSPEAMTRCVHTLQNWLHEQGAQPPHIVRSRLPPLRRGNSGKLARVLALGGRR
jgi:phenylacetate-CoA ligase